MWKSQKATLGWMKRREDNPKHQKFRRPKIHGGKNSGQERQHEEGMGLF